MHTAIGAKVSFSDTSSNPPDLMEMSGSNFATSVRPSSRNDPTSRHNQGMSPTISESQLDAIGGGNEAPDGSDLIGANASSPMGGEANIIFPRCAASLEDGDYHLVENTLSDPHE